MKNFALILAAWILVWASGLCGAVYAHQCGFLSMRWAYTVVGVWTLAGFAFVEFIDRITAPRSSR